jgi:hypothetical protein
MMRHIAMLPFFLVAVIALILGASFPNSWADDDDGDEMPFKDAEIFIEFNSTDGDTGIQVFLDDDGWKKITIEDPNDLKIFQVKGEGTVKKLGLTELFFESVEPELGDLSLEDFLDLFPEGDYEFEGKRNDGIELESEVAFTHIIPCGPELVSPEEGDVLVPNSDVVISWEEVTQVVDPMLTYEDEVVCDNSDDLEIESYQVIVESEDSELTVILPAEDSSLKVPSEIIKANTAYKFEVLAKEESGNQTITESFFCTGPDFTEAECEALVDAL